MMQKLNFVYEKLNHLVFTDQYEMVVLEKSSASLGEKSSIKSELFEVLENTEFYILQLQCTI